ncbi:MAG: metallophosphoesterase [Planctomycetes bacterium]|nr:metallophosphoesterase [Planctomycetota bacterium]
MRFLHTADWQLGMSRASLSPEARPRFVQARFDAVRRLGAVAAEHGCEFIAVAGDVFESNQVDRQTVARALQAIHDLGHPVYLLPGNHDPLDAATVYRHTTFLARRPDNLRVIGDNRPIAVRDGVELIGAPWPGKRPLTDLAAAALRGLPRAAPGTTRIAVAHGIVDTLSPDAADPARIALAEMEGALADGRIHYLALGDRHSATRVGVTGRIFYSGAPEATDYGEVRPGCALVVDAGPERCDVTEVETGEWRFLERGEVPLAGSEDLAALQRFLDERPDKERTLVKLRLRGALPLALDAALREMLSHARDLFAALEVREKDYAVLPEDSDFAGLGLAGFAKTALDELRGRAGTDTPEGAAAREALALLVRLIRRVA